MTTLGPHLKITAARTHRERLRDILTGALGLPLVHRGDAIEVFALGAGSVAFVYVDPADALSEADARKGAWIELVVADPRATGEALAAQGVEPFGYHDAAHSYFALPGGQVLRLAPA